MQIDRDGGDPDDLVSTDDSIEGPLAQSSSRPDRLNLNFAPEAQGWFKGTFLDQIPMVAIIIAFKPLAAFDEGGFETLAQVYRESLSKLKNLEIGGYRVLVRGHLRRCDGFREIDPFRMRTGRSTSMSIRRRRSGLHTCGWEILQDIFSWSPWVV